VLENSQDNSDIIDSILHSDGKYYKELWKESPNSTQTGRIVIEDIQNGKIYPKMNGRTIFKHAITKIACCCIRTIKKK